MGESSEAGMGSVEMSSETAYIDDIHQKNNHLFDLKSTQTEQYRKELEKWQEDIKARMAIIRGDVNLKPKTSIIIPAYNEERYILQLLDSIASQHGCDSIEVLVVANNCTDQTSAFAKACGARVLEYTYPKESPQSKYPSKIADARQRGIETVESEFIVTTDSDAILPQEFITHMVSPLQNESSVAAVCCGVKQYDTEDFSTKLADQIIEAVRNSVTKLVNPITLGSATAYRRADINDIGGYPRNLTYAEDVWVGKKLAERGKIRFLPDQTAYVSARRTKEEIKKRGLLPHLFNEVRGSNVAHVSQDEASLNIR